MKDKLYVVLHGFDEEEEDFEEASDIMDREEISEYIHDGYKEDFVVCELVPVWLVIKTKKKRIVKETKEYYLP